MTHEDIFTRLKEFVYTSERAIHHASFDKFPMKTSIDVVLSPENFNQFQIGCHELRFFTKSKDAEILEFNKIHFNGIEITAYLLDSKETDLLVFWTDDKPFAIEKL